MPWQYGTFLPRNFPPCPGCGSKDTDRMLAAASTWECRACRGLFVAAWITDFKREESLPEGATPPPSDDA